MSDRRWQLVGGYGVCGVESEGYVARMRGLYPEDCPFNDVGRDQAIGHIDIAEAQNRWSNHVEIAKARDEWLAGWLRAEREIEAVAETNRLRFLVRSNRELVGFFETIRGHTWPLIERLETLGCMEASMLVRAAQHRLNDALSSMLNEK